MLTGPRLLPRSGGKAKKLVVFCHGYGSNGDDLISLAPHWAPTLPDVEFLSPNAPQVFESYSSGYQWFSLREFTSEFIRSGLDQATPILRDFLLHELYVRNLTPEDLAIVGFSQGGMIALDVMFLLPGIAGIICYSGAFYPRQSATINKPYPNVLLAHGDNDDVVPYDYFLESHNNLVKLGVQPQTLTCSGLGHSIDSEGLNTGGTFLSNLFAGDDK
jgi:phospholipase/carboxylesterase